MSKAALKKVLNEMPRQELVELILNAYSAHKETKDFFEFFLDPDVDKLQEKYKDLIFKELKRTKRGGYSKGRISVLKRYYKEFMALQPGFQAQIKFLRMCVLITVGLEMYLNMSDTLINGAANFLREMLAVANANEVLEPTLADLEAAFHDEKRGTRYLRSHMMREIRNYLEEIKPELPAGR